jgi:microcystin-dependent protein
MNDWALWIILFALFFFVIMSLFYTQYVRRERIEMQKEAVVGDMKYSARRHDFSHWLLCDGRSLHRDDYKELFHVIGTNYGSSSATTFNLPDFRGRVMGGIGQGVDPTTNRFLTDRLIGTVVGEEKHTMTVPELVTHRHTGVTDVSGLHVHTGTIHEDGSHGHTGTTNATGSHTHDHNAPGGQDNMGLARADGSNTAEDTDPTSGELNLWTTPEALQLESAGQHSHSLTINSNGSHTHSVTIDPNGSHTHSFTTHTTGETVPFNVMQPTLFAGNVFIYYGCD